MTTTLKFYLNALLLVFLCLFLGIGRVHAQNERPKNPLKEKLREDRKRLRAARDTLKKKKVREPLELFPMSARIGTDISNLGWMAFDFDKQRVDLNTELSFNNVLFFVADAGYSNIRSASDVGYRFEYENTGFYFRTGLDYNFLHKILKQESVFAGLRYGYGTGQHRLTYIFQDYWGGPFLENVEEDGLSVSWAELTLGARARLLRYFVAGFTVRYQRMLSLTDGVQVQGEDFPGFGKVSDNSNFLINAHLFYRLPLGRW